MEKQFVYVLSGEFNSQTDCNDFLRVFTDEQTALTAYRDYVEAEKASDFVTETDYEIFADFERLESLGKCEYYYGTYDNEYYTKVKLQKVEIE